MEDFPNRPQPAGDASPARILRAARELSLASVRLTFRAPVAYVYHPLTYAWVAHESYVSRYASGPKRVLFLGMNPGPFGMMQTGVPFGEVAAVRDWLGISAEVGPPARWHPKRPVEGFACARSEVSGRRLWGLFRSRFRTADRFFADHFVANYCPLAFLDEGGRNLTPDRFPAAETKSLFAACDAHLRELVTALRPRWVIGVGDFAEKRARLVLDAEVVPGARSTGLRFGRVLHPSPASPAANRDWAGAATRQLEALGVW
jgi:single-strand selective monofunctional uracil DNA glycosylase